VNPRLKGNGEMLLEGLFTLAWCCWLGALGIMLAAGILHAEVLAIVTPVGYWPSFALYWCLGLARLGWNGLREWEPVK
jgi:hypothetical protein